MSGTSALLNLLEGSGSALLNAPEAAQNGVSEADSSYFVSLMKQYEDSEGLEEPSAPESRDPALELLGNGLPISVTTPLILPAAVEAEADTRLEEFAVGLGIDRELARLLLRETAAQPTVTQVESTALPLPQPFAIEPLVAPSSDQPVVPAQAVMTVTPIANQGPKSTPDVANRVTAPLPVESPPRSDRAAPPSGIDLKLPPLENAIPVSRLAERPMAMLKVSDAGPQITSTMTPSPPMVPSASTTPQASTAPSLIDPTMAPPADLSLTPRSEIPAPRASDIPLTIAGNAAPALRDEDVLRWRAFIHRSSSGTREPVQEIAVQAASDEVLDPVSGSPRRGLSEVDFAAATASLRGFALERRQILTSTATPVSSTVLNGVLPGDSPVNPAVLPLAGTAPPSVPVTAQADPLTTPLRVPDPALQHELRAEQFAEQVGRRMLQQIREDRWTVHLQLDPQRLGPMEIELQLEGNQVTAQVGVANAEVRHLLESALPKLRESLDSAGLNLANWSFAQSGAREYREFAQQSAAAAAKATPKGVEGAIEDEVPRRVTEDSASRVVDVYV
jgi:flagellar hook-length control protein FliK